MVGSQPRSISLTGCAALGKLFNFCIPHSRILYRDQGWHLPLRVLRIKQLNKCKAQKNCLAQYKCIVNNSCQETSVANKGLSSQSYGFSSGHVWM